MARHQKHTFGQILIAGAAELAVNVLVKDGNEHALIATCTTVPSATAGFAKGCLLIKTDAGAGIQSLYENVGTTASCSFNLIGAVAVGEITLAEGSIMVGNSSSVGVALSAKTDKKILVGNGTTITSVLVSGDITMDNAGAVTIGAKKVLDTMISAAAGTVLVGTKTSLDVTALDISAEGAMVLGQGAGETPAAKVMSGAITMDKLGVTTLVGAMDIATIVSAELDHAAFTDNLDATGYIDIGTQIPVGAIVLGWKAVCSEGFAGDTTAIIQVGVAGTLDKYSASTAGSVLAPGTVGSSVKAGNQYHDALTTARVTVTGGADWGNITAGKVVVTIYYVPTA